MDPVTGALVAAAVGWTSILAVVVAPIDRVVAPERLRAVGALTLGLVGLSALGVPLPDATPIGLMTVGLLGAALETPLREGVTLPRVGEAGLPGCRVADPDRPETPETDLLRPVAASADRDPLPASIPSRALHPRGGFGIGPTGPKLMTF